MNTVNLPKSPASVSLSDSALNIIIAILFITAYSITIGINAMLFALILCWFIAYIGIYYGIDRKNIVFKEYLIGIQLTLLAMAIAYFTRIPPVLICIPVLVGLVTTRDVKVFLIPVFAAAIMSIFLQLYGNKIDITIALAVLFAAFMVNREFAKLKTGLAQRLDSEYQLKQQRDTHLSFLKQLQDGRITDVNQFAVNDTIGNALYDLGVKLTITTEEDKKRSWQMSGLNELNAIIRSSSDMEGRYNVLISFVVKYINANQGGLFVINNENHRPTLELKACYAYEKTRMNQKSMGINEGLVGQCVLEKQMIYLKEIPEDYVHITSGLGLATPTSLVMIPLQYNDEILGVLELASFSKFSNHQLEFLKKVSEVIGGAILSFQRAAYTKKMLEESQQLSEELRSQQEEVRQNMEELEATQEHLIREGKEREKLQDEIKKSKEFLNLVIDSVPVPVFVKNRQHQMILVNQAVCDLNNLSREEMLGKSDYDFFSKEEADVFWNMEEKIFADKAVSEKTEKVNRHGKETMTIDKKLVIETQDGENFLVGINIDVTQYQYGPEETVGK